MLIKELNKNTPLKRKQNKDLIATKRILRNKNTKRVIAKSKRRQQTHLQAAHLTSKATIYAAIACRTGG